MQPTQLPNTKGHCQPFLWLKPGLRKHRQQQTQSERERKIWSDGDSSQKQWKAMQTDRQTHTHTHAKQSIAATIESDAKSKRTKRIE